MPTTSPTLLHRLALPGDSEAWESFVALYSPLIEARCRAWGLQEADREEIRSRVLASLVTALRGFVYDPARQFRGYLAAAVNNAIRKYWLECGQHPGIQGTGDTSVLQQLAAVEGVQPMESLADELDASIHANLLRAQEVMARVRGQVEPATWEAWWRTAIEGTPPGEVAQTLGKSVAAIYMAKCRVGKLLLAEGNAIGRDS